MAHKELHNKSPIAIGSYNTYLASNCDLLILLVTNWTVFCVPIVKLDGYAGFCDACLTTFVYQVLKGSGSYLTTNCTNKHKELGYTEESTIWYWQSIKLMVQKLNWMQSNHFNTRKEIMLYLTKAIMIDAKQWGYWKICQKVTKRNHETEMIWWR